MQNFRHVIHCESQREWNEVLKWFKDNTDFDAKFDYYVNECLYIRNSGIRVGGLHWYESHKNTDYRNFKFMTVKEFLAMNSYKTLQQLNDLCIKRK